MNKYKGDYQHDEKDCGIACLSTICRFYGSKIPITRIRDMGKPNADGYCIDELISIAKQLGFDAMGLFGEKNEFIDAIKNEELLMPAIAHIRLGTDDFHYIVIWEIKGKAIKIFDPSKGNVKLSLEEFFEYWTGYIISVVKTERFFSQNLKKGQYNYYISILAKGKSIFCCLFVISILITGISIGGILIYKEVIDCFAKGTIEEQAMNVWLVIFTILLVVYFIRMLLLFLRGKMITYFGSKVEKQIMGSYFQELLNLKISFYDSYKNGEVISRYYDINKVKDILTEIPVSFVLDFFMILGIIIAIGKMNLIMLVITVIILGGYFILLYIFNASLFSTNRMIAEKETRAIALLKEVIDGIELVKSHCAEQYFHHKMCSVGDEAVSYKYKNFYLYSRNMGILSFVESLAELIVLGIGIYLINKGKLSIGELITITTLIRYLFSVIENFAEMQNKILTAGISLERLNDIFQGEKEPISGKTDVNMDKSIHSFDICFGYNSYQCVLQNINFSFEDKEKIAILGKSGCGKSTLIKLLNQFYAPDSGKITIDEINIDDISRNWLRKSVGYVSQEPFVFSASIRDNILLGIKKSDKEIREVLKECELVQDASALEEYLDRNAMTLSKGEKQRLSLARELLKNPRILILDEFTSNLDEKTKNNICDMIFEKNITCLVVTHNFEIAKRCNRIFIMNEGTITELKSCVL